MRVIKILSIWCIVLGVISSCAPVVYYRSQTALTTSSCESVSMKTFTNQLTPSYPVGVFNTAGDYLGTATTQEEFVTLWNADTTNQLQGQIEVSPSSTLDFCVTSGELSEVRGLRFWQIDVDTNAYILCDQESRIYSEGTLRVGSVGSSTYVTILSLSFFLLSTKSFI
jgi:hypothetical protein